MNSYMKSFFKSGAWNVDLIRLNEFNYYTALQKKILKYTNDEYDHFLCFFGR